MLVDWLVTAGDLDDGRWVMGRRQVRGGGLFAARVGPAADSDRQRARDRARELADLYAGMKAMRYGRRR